MHIDDASLVQAMLLLEAFNKIGSDGSINSVDLHLQIADDLRAAAAGAESFFNKWLLPLEILEVQRENAAEGSIFNDILRALSTASTDFWTNSSYGTRR
jgi:hypothetical protein